MRILIYHGKHGKTHWLADSKEQLNAAMWKLFTILDEQGCYTEDETHSFTLRMARAGNAKCVRAILEPSHVWASSTIALPWSVRE